MSQRPLLVVFDATGAEGSEVARVLLQAPDRPFRVRAVTPHPGCAAAQALAALGAEICAADPDDPASDAHALHGAFGVFRLLGPRADT